MIATFKVEELTLVADQIVLEGAEPFDLELGHGDAQLMSNIPDETYDYVYSSHCLEHMRDIPETIKNWCRILKVGGWMYIVVPEYIYYEKCTWPPKFNLDHKHSFSYWLSRKQVGRDNHWDASILSGYFAAYGLNSMIVTPEILNFDYNKGIEDQTMKNAICQISFIGKKD